MLGLLLGHYRIIEELGEGGTSTVYRACDTKENREVALKCLNQKANKDESLRLLFQEEFKRLSEIRHPNFPTAFDIGGLSNCPFFAMELIRGSHFDQFEKENLSHFYKILMQMLQALSFLHDRGYVHRDLKPENLIITPDNTLKIMDLGLLTPIGTMESCEFRGTPSYAAPEVIRSGLITEATDIYSLGVLCYESLSAELPFKGTETDVLKMHLYQQPRFLGEIRPDLPNQLCDIVHRMLLKEPSERYRFVSQIANDLSRLCGSTLLFENSSQKAGYLATAHMAGRQNEWEKIGAAITQVKNGKNQAMFIKSAAGIGKSRLLREARLRAKLDGCKVFLVEVTSQAQAPFSVITQLIESTLHGLLFNEIENKFLSMFLHYSKATSDLSLAPEKIAEEVISWISNLSRTQPVAVLVDDLHWADLPSIDLLNRVIRKLESVPVLIIGSFREEEITPGSPILHTIEEGLTELVSLEHLKPREVQELLQATFLHDVPEIFVQEIYRASGGNCYFIQELLRYLMDEDFITRKGGFFNLPTNLSQIPFPSGLYRTIEGRLDRLTENARSLIEEAAVLDGFCTMSLWFAISDLSLNEFLEAINLLQQRQFIQRWEDKFHFLHANSRSMILSAMSPERSRIIHQRVGEILEKENSIPRSQLIPMLASYFARGTDKELGVHYSLEAGKIALEKGAQTEAFLYFKKAEGILASMPLSKSQQEKLYSIYEKAAELSSAVWDDAPTCLKWFNEVIEYYDRSEVVERCNERARDQEKVFSFSLSYAVTLAIAGRYQEARKVFTRLSSYIENNPFQWAVLHGSGVCLVDWYEGFHCDCLNNAEKAIEIFKTHLTKDSPDTDFYPYSWALFWREKARSYLGMPINLDNIEEIRRLSQVGRSDKTILWHAMTAVGARATFTGQLNDLLDWKTWAEESLKKMGKTFWFECWILHSYIYGMLGAFQYDSIGEYVVRLFHSPDPYQKRLGWLFKGRLALAYGNLDAAMQSLEQFLREEENDGLDNSYLEGLLYLGLCRVEQKKWDEAEYVSNKGLALAANGKRANPILEVQFREVIAKIMVNRGLTQNAWLELNRCIKLLNGADNPIREGWIYATMAQVASAEADCEKAANYLFKARNCFQEIRNSGALLQLEVLENSLQRVEPFGEYQSVSKTRKEGLGNLETQCDV